MGVTCNNRWKNDGRFVKYRLPLDENKEKFIPFCNHPAHIGLIADNEYRFRKCEKRGSGNYCKYYERFRPESSFKKKIVTDTLEVSVEYENGTSSSVYSSSLSSSSSSEE